MPADFVAKHVNTFSEELELEYLELKSEIALSQTEKSKATPAKYTKWLMKVTTQVTEHPKILSALKDRWGTYLEGQPIIKLLVAGLTSNCPFQQGKHYSSLSSF